MDTQTDQTQQTPRQAYADWPQKGEQRPQPWDLQKIGINPADLQLEQGAPDTISPIVIRHSFPILTSGSASPAVGELAQRLQILGYPTDVSRGENPFGSVTQEIMAAVGQFREDYGVQEDPTPYGGNTEQSRARAANTIGPFTWEALLRASDRTLQAA